MYDVDYLVEDNAMDDFCLSSEMDETHGKSTFEDDPEQQLLRCRLGTKCKCWNDSGNWGRVQQSRVSPLFEKVIT